MTAFQAQFTYRLIDRASKQAAIMARNFQRLEGALNRSGVAFNNFERRAAIAASSVEKSKAAFKGFRASNSKSWKRSAESFTRFSNSFTDAAARVHDARGRFAIPGAGAAQPRLPSASPRVPFIGGGNALFGGVAGIYAGVQTFQGTVGNALKREDIFASVEKVLGDDLSGAGIEGIKKGITNITRAVPRGWAEIASITEQAAQTGIKSEDLLRFTEFTAKASTAFDTVAGDTGKAFAKIKNIFKLPQAGIESVADSINHLSNNMSSSAAEIIEFTKNAAAAAAPLNLTATQVNALGSSLIALGVIPSFAARSVRKLGTVLDGLTKGGGTKAQKSAIKALDIDFKAWSKLKEKDGKAALLSLFKSLNRSSKKTGILFDLVGQQHIGTLGRLAESPEQLAKALSLVANNAEFAGSVTDEFAKKAGTNKAKIQLLFNSISAAGAALGARFTDSLGGAANALANYLNTPMDRVSVFERISTAYNEFMKGFGGLGDGSGKGPLTKLMDFIFGDSDTVGMDTVRLREMGANLKQFGKDVRSFVGKAAQKVSGFFASVEKFVGLEPGAISRGLGSFVKYALLAGVAAKGVSILGRALFGVVSFAARLSGLTLLYRMLKGIAGLAGIGRVAAGVGAVGKASEKSSKKVGLLRRAFGSLKKIRLASLLTPIVWGASLIPPIKWKSLLKGGFKLSNLLRPLVWTARLLGGPISWALIATELAWHTIIKPLGWDEYLNLAYLKEQLGKAKTWIEDINTPENRAKRKNIKEAGNKAKQRLAGVKPETIERLHAKASNDNVVRQTRQAPAAVANNQKLIKKVDEAVNVARQIRQAPAAVVRRQAPAPNVNTAETVKVKSEVSAKFDPARLDVGVNVQGPSVIPITVNGQQQGSASFSTSTNHPRAKNLPVSTTTKNGGATSHAKAS